MGRVSRSKELFSLTCSAIPEPGKANSARPSGSVKNSLVSPNLGLETQILGLPRPSTMTSLPWSRSLSPRKTLFTMTLAPKILGLPAFLSRYLPPGCFLPLLRRGTRNERTEPEKMAPAPMTARFFRGMTLQDLDGVWDWTGRYRKSSRHNVIRIFRLDSENAEVQIILVFGFLSSHLLNSTTEKSGYLVIFSLAELTHINLIMKKTR